MHGDTLRFLEYLFERASAPGYVTLSALPPADTQPTPSRHIEVHDLTRLTAALDDLQTANRQGWGAVVGIALRKANLGRWHRGGKSDLTSLPALFVDCDHPGQLEQLRSFWLPPSCLVHSGWGHHAYWFLHRPTQQFAFAESIMRGLAECFGGDNVTSSAHSLRLVGTINTKPGRAAFPCSLVELCPERRYALADFAAYVQAPMPSRQTESINPHRSVSAIYSQHHLRPDQVESAVRAVSDSLLHNYGGYTRRNGWIAACCPFGHTQDRPGMHFGWSPQHKCGRCFGRHGSVGLLEMCRQLGVSLPIT